MGRDRPSWPKVQRQLLHVDAPRLFTGLVMLPRPRSRVLLSFPSISVSDLSQVPWGQHLGPFPHRRPLVWASQGEADGLPGPPHPTAGPAPPRAFSLSPGRVCSRADSTPPLVSAAPSTARRPASPRSASISHCCYRSFAELPPAAGSQSCRTVNQG